MEQNRLLEGPARRTGISLPENLVTATRERASREDRPFSWVIRRALVVYLAGSEKELKPETG